MGEYYSVIMVLNFFLPGEYYSVMRVLFFCTELFPVMRSIICSEMAEN